MAAFPLRFHLVYDNEKGQMEYQAHGKMGKKPIVYVPHPESPLVPSEMGTLFLVSWTRTLAEYSTHNVVGVTLHEELRPLVEVEGVEEIVIPVDKRIKAILHPARSKAPARTNHRARERSARAYNKPGMNRKSKDKAAKA